MRGRRIRIVAEINTNSIAVTEGWGTTEFWATELRLRRFDLYRTAIDRLCFLRHRDGGG